MGYIYLITNLINSKKYVGKTTNTIKERWQEHCQDSQKERYEKRPLYDAFNKYGIENFKIEQLEYVKDDSKLSEREIYWINELQTYGRMGYNATKGGDGKILYDHNEIIELYNLGYTQKQIADKLGCIDETVRNVLKAHNIDSSKNYKESLLVDQFDLAGNYIQTFSNCSEAARYMLEIGKSSNLNSATSGIQMCAKGKRKSACGYKWVLKKLPNN